MYDCWFSLNHDDEAAEWFGLSEREVNWVRTAKVGNDEDGHSEGVLGIDEAGWFSLRVRTNPYEAAVLDGEAGGADGRDETDASADADRSDLRPVG